MVPWDFSLISWADATVELLVRELHWLNVHVVLETREGLGLPRGMVVEKACDLGRGNGNHVCQDGHGNVKS